MKTYLDMGAGRRLATEISARSHRVYAVASVRIAGAPARFVGVAATSAGALESLRAQIVAAEASPSPDAA